MQRFLLTRAPTALFPGDSTCFCYSNVAISNSFETSPLKVFGGVTGRWGGERGESGAYGYISEGSEVISAKLP